MGRVHTLSRRQALLVSLSSMHWLSSKLQAVQYLSEPILRKDKADVFYVEVLTSARQHEVYCHAMA